ncbi:hemerythrin domain-containing protein [Salibacteraceae bacterium]|jgi:iron-sulfur cluster repair protein YtfE (RIC family)|nr:hemerythrin domain-containing protein [Flavobacteriales bacterium]MDB9701353.1 hemerythrin domain-containing protein [Salibacteraceae bacterium]
MKRHDALSPFSRAHHEFLILSQVLKSDVPDYKGMPTDTIGRQNYALDVYTNRLQPHMELEESRLFPLLSGLHASIDQLIYILIDDHAEIDIHFKRMQGDSSISLGTEWMMDQLGRIIEQHIRLEEREFFELIQAHASPELMDKIMGIHSV